MHNRKEHQPPTAPDRKFILWIAIGAVALIFFALAMGVHNDPDISVFYAP